mmetsp:Transcript_15922/g.32323  ORF Transcript_15922/g.32323 Transcript_15922/m.32323 type:complete len:353 (-) Transcript_15922:123-1181(-)
MVVTTRKAIRKAFWRRSMRVVHAQREILLYKEVQVPLPRTHRCLLLEPVFHCDRAVKLQKHNRVLQEFVQPINHREVHLIVPEGIGEGSSKLQHAHEYQGSEKESNRGEQRRGCAHSICPQEEVHHYHHVQEVKVLKRHRELYGVNHCLLQNARLQQLVDQALEGVRRHLGRVATISTHFRAPLQQDEGPLVLVEVLQEGLLVRLQQPLPQQFSPFPIRDVRVGLVEEENNRGGEPPGSKADMTLARFSKMEPYFEGKVIEVSEHFPAQVVEGIVPAKTLVRVEHLEEGGRCRYHLHLVPPQAQEAARVVGPFKIAISEGPAHRQMEQEERPEFQMAENKRHHCVRQPKGGD